ncbi:MAG: hypothetical protein ABSF71_02135 [Terriglobia bacterium]|jgi:Tfp pilus assembly protein PilX
MRELHGQARRCGALQESGIALILVLLVMLVLMLLSTALVFTARSETIASTNYALDTQADYVAKAGIENALNWFRSAHYTTVSETQAATDYQVTGDGSAYNLYTSNSNPVLCIANCSTNNSRVQLIGYGSASSNFPSGVTNGSGTPIAAAFASDLNNSGNGVRVTGDSTHSGLFYVNAYLLNYQTVLVSGTATPQETWLITSKGVWTGKSSQTGAIATAEEQAIFQPIYTSGSGEALYGYCSVTMEGSAGVCTDAYNSSLGDYAGGNISVAAGVCDQTTYTNVGTGGNVGANGFVDLSKNPTVNGNVVIGNATPSSIPSTCCSGSSCGAQTSGGNVTGSIITGAPFVTAPGVPTFPGSGQTGPFPGTAPSENSSQTIPQTAGGVAATADITPGTGNTYTQPCIAGQTCNGSKANPYMINSISPNGSNTVTLYGGSSESNPVYYDIDSINFSGQAAIAINGFVVLNVKDTLSITGQGIANGINNSPEQCQIFFAGNSANLGGNGEISAVITAPLASFSLGGGGSKGSFLGAISALSIDDQGGYPVHYDIQLSKMNGSLSQSLVSSYTRIKQ